MTQASWIKQLSNNSRPNLPVAAQWLLFAGKEIYDCEEVTQGQDEGLWKGKSGFSKARWDFWRERAR